MTFRVGFVTGAMPDKWADTWRERRREPIELVPLHRGEQEPALREGRVDMALVRLPVDREGLHLIPLYDEVPVAVMGAEHVLTLADELTTATSGTSSWSSPSARAGAGAEQLDWPPMSERDAVETVAAGTGVAVVPMSVARLHHRREATYPAWSPTCPTHRRPGLAGRRDGELPQTFIGIVRGRPERSSRG